MFYKIIRFFFWVLTHLLCRYRVSGREHIPNQGPLLIVPNHLIWYDPALLGVIFPRRIWFMAKIEVFRVPLLGLSARLTGQIPVHRGASDRSAIESALAYLRAGRAVMIFPEGTVARQQHLLAAHTGVAMLALRSGAPILPVAHTGTRRIFVGRRAWIPRVEVRIGEPYVPQIPQGVSRKVALRIVTEDIMRRIALMIPPEERGPYSLAIDGPESEQKPADAPQNTFTASVVSNVLDADDCIPERGQPQLSSESVANGSILQ